MDKSDDSLVESYEISSEGDIAPFSLDETTIADKKEKRSKERSEKKLSKDPPGSRLVVDSSYEKSHPKKEDFPSENPKEQRYAKKEKTSDKEEFATLENLIFIHEPDETTEAEAVWKEWGITRPEDRPYSKEEIEQIQDLISEEELEPGQKSFPFGVESKQAQLQKTPPSPSPNLEKQLDPPYTRGEKKEQTQKRKQSLTTELILDSLDILKEDVEKEDAEKKEKEEREKREKLLHQKKPFPLAEEEVRIKKTNSQIQKVTETTAFEERKEERKEERELKEKSSFLDLENLETGMRSSAKIHKEERAEKETYKETYKEKSPGKPENRTVSESLQSLAFLVQTEKESLETQFHEAFSPYFYTEVCFLEEKEWIPQAEIAQKLEENHQKLLFILSKGQNLSRETVLYLGVFYFLTHRNYEGIRFIEPFLEPVGSASSSSRISWKDQALLYNLVGNFSYRMGMKDRARALFMKALELKEEIKGEIKGEVKEEKESPFSSVHFSLAYFCMQDQKYEKAYSHFLEAEKHFSESGQFLLFMGQTCEALGKIEECIQYYEQFLLIEEDSSILVKMAQMTYEKSYHGKALNYFEQIQIPELIPFIEYKKAICYFYVGRRETALRTMADWLNVSKGGQSVDLDLLESFVQAYQKKAYDSFIFDVFQSLTKDLGIQYERFLEQYIDIRSIQDSFVLFSISQYFFRRKKYKTCFRYLIRALSLDKNYFPALQNLAKLYYKKGRTRTIHNQKKGWKIFLYLLRFGKTDGEIDFYLGEYFWERKDLSKAQFFLKNSLEKEYRSFSLYRILGYLSLERKESVEAMKYLKEALLLAPKSSIHFRVELGKLYLEAGEYSKSIELFREVLQKDPMHKSAHYELSKAYKEVLKNESEKHYAKYIHLN